MAFPGDPPTCTSMSSVPKPDLAPEAEIVEDDEEQSLPQPEEEAVKLGRTALSDAGAVGHGVTGAVGSVIGGVGHDVSTLESHLPGHHTEASH